MEKKAKISIILLLALVSGTLFFTACEDFNKPLVPFIAENLAVIRGLGMIINSPHCSASCANHPGEIAVDANSFLSITIPLFNHYNVNLSVNFVNTGYSNQSGIQPKLSEDRKYLTIYFQPGYDETFYLTIKMIKMDENHNTYGPEFTYTLPPMRARFINNDLESLVITGLKGSEVALASYNAFNTDQTTYNVSVRQDVEELQITAALQDSKGSPNIVIVHDSVTKEWKSDDGIGKVSLNDDKETIYINVIADCGKVKTYTLNVTKIQKTKPPALSIPSIQSRGTGNNTVVLESVTSTNPENSTVLYGVSNSATTKPADWQTSTDFGSLPTTNTSTSNRFFFAKVVESANYEEIISAPRAIAIRQINFDIKSSSYNGVGGNLGGSATEHIDQGDNDLDTTTNPTPRRTRMYFNVETSISSTLLFIHSYTYGAQELDSGSTNSILRLTQTNSSSLSSLSVPNNASLVNMPSNKFESGNVTISGQLRGEYNTFITPSLPLQQLTLEVDGSGSSFRYMRARGYINVMFTWEP